MRKRKVLHSLKKKVSRINFAAACARARRRLLLARDMVFVAKHLSDLHPLFMWNKKSGRVYLWANEKVEKSFGVEKLFCKVFSTMWLVCIW